MERVLSRLLDLEADLDRFAEEIAEALKESHRMVRAITKEGQIKVNYLANLDINKLSPDNILIAPCYLSAALLASFQNPSHSSFIFTTLNSFAFVV